MSKKAYLILENGKIFKGLSLGEPPTSKIGEVVFTTGMTGYQETLTDPRSSNLIIVSTFPSIGNYGVNSNDNESDYASPLGFVCREYCFNPSNFRCEGDIDNFLLKNSIPGVYNIDTRELTKILREEGSMNGVIVSDISEKDKIISELKNHKPKPIVIPYEKNDYFSGDKDSAKYKIALLNFGYKKSLLKELLNRESHIFVFPGNTKADEILSGDFDAVILSDGSNDIEFSKTCTKTIKELFDAKIPLLGIGLGHELAAYSNLAVLENLKYGHRGANQPVYDITNKRTYITSQNHSFIVKEISEDIALISHINANDKTCEGLIYKKAPAFTVAYNPDSVVYDRFFANIKNIKSKNEVK